MAKVTIPTVTFENSQTSNSCGAITTLIPGIDASKIVGVNGYIRGISAVVWLNSTYGLYFTSFVSLNTSFSNATVVVFYTD